MALARIPPLPAACHNRLVVLKQELLCHGDAERLAEVQPALALALHACPESAELYVNAADLCAVAGNCDAGRQADRWADLALTHLGHAIRLGLDPGGLPFSPLYARLKREQPKRFRAVLQTPRPKTADVPTARLVNPFPNGALAP